MSHYYRVISGKSERINVVSTILARQCGNGNFEWYEIDGSQPDPTGDDASFFTGDGEYLREKIADGVRLVMLLAAEDVVVKTVVFDNHERKLLHQTIPYSLEDDSVDDVDGLHFSLGSAEANTVPLAIVSKKILERIIFELKSDGIEADQLESELHAIPIDAGSWSIVVEDRRWLVRSGNHEGFSLQPTIAGQALEILLESNDELPQHLTIYCQPEQQSEVLSIIPERLQSAIDWKIANYWQVMSKGHTNHQKNAINLLQGQFAAKLPWKKWWQSWRTVAVLLIAVVIIQMGVRYTQLVVLDDRNIALRAAIEKQYRQAVPKGALMDPERQLRRKVNALKGSASSNLMSMLVQIGPVLKATDGISLQSLNYNEKQSEFRITILASGFDDVETVRANLENLGLTAELTGSNADGNSTRARLRIRG
ncbi:general secretion pathway protein L [marine gamma proteobacterium HTCC2143]|uniref:Type II secretion system protein L n=1 Tax=marine gamma proteobacterium HTCC2143 TaxID=247633 RepID=A0YG41_9GAMM|nr:general secretion pathway protein L [marine gamma proteobacterium HTCC2143]